MALTLLELTQIADAVTRRQDAALSVVRVASTDVESGRVELLVTVSGCHEEPCTFLLNLSRDERRRFEEELKTGLRAELERHLNAGAS
jgi:hypothetical protein